MVVGANVSHAMKCYQFCISIAYRTRASGLLAMQKDCGAMLFRHWRRWWGMWMTI